MSTPPIWEAQEGLPIGILHSITTTEMGGIHEFAPTIRRISLASFPGFSFACQSGFCLIERSNSILPVHYLNPIFYIALLSVEASLGKAEKVT